MAIAKRRGEITRTTDIDAPFSVNNNDVELLLTIAEAETLLDLVSRVGGDSVQSRRKHADAIGNALGTANVTVPDAGTVVAGKMGFTFTTRDTLNYNLPD